MAPSLQSQDPSVSFSATLQTPSQDKSTALLFKRPTRPLGKPLGPNFGKARLKPDGAGSAGGEWEDVQRVVGVVWESLIK